MASLPGKTLLAATQPLKPLMPRMRPTLIIIGAQKAGTNTLYDLLSHHPRIIQPRVKEVLIFSDEAAYAHGMGHYRSFFPRRPVLGRAITFDASPMYLYHASCAERITRHLPDALCLAILRDPVERAFSAWNMYHRFKSDPRNAHLHDPRSFDEAVEDELSGRQVDSARRYLDRGLYMPQLARYLSAVGPDRLLVRGFEQVKADPAGLVNGVLARLGLEALPADHPAFATRSNARAYGSVMSAAMTDRLRTFFAEDMEQVQRTFGIRLSPQH